MIESSNTFEKYDQFFSEGRLIYEYNPKTGILKLSSDLFLPNELEFLVSSLKNRPKESGLGISMMPVGTRIFYGVKEIIPFIPEESSFKR